MSRSVQAAGSSVSGLTAQQGPILDIRDLRVRFATPNQSVRAVNGIDLDVRSGEILAIVGESGSGKSVSMLSVMGLLPSPPATVTGSIRFQGQELLGLSRRAMNRIRGDEIAMIFQDPMSSLNPVHSVGRQIVETLRLHRGTSKAAGRKRAIELLDRVGIPDAGRRVDDFPHELSGGMRQRAMIAMALACGPKLLIADEPTTALDVTVQSQIVNLVRSLQEDVGMAVIWITHDLGVVAELADRVAVMYAGRVMEEAPAGEVYRNTRHPYTSGLLRSIPRLDRPISSRLPEIPGSPKTVVASLDGCAFEDRCPIAVEDCLAEIPPLIPTDRPGHSSACIRAPWMAEGRVDWAPADLPHAVVDDASNGSVVISVKDLKVHFPLHRGLMGRPSAVVRAVDGVDIEVRRGATLGVVGESGCGKTTLGRSLVGLVSPTAGEIQLDGQHLKDLGAGERRRVQMIFQDPFSSMNPGMRVGDIISEPMRIHRLYDDAETARRVTDLLEQVGLPGDSISRYPHEFSGGQRQRIAVARALAADPEVIICDEAVSSLDVSVQAQIVNLLHTIQEDKGVGYLFVAHDLAVVRHISDEVAVMYLGKIVERSSQEELYENPLHPYTKALLMAVPVPEPGRRADFVPLTGDVPSPMNPPAGCHFHTRCPLAVPGLCDVDAPAFREVVDGRWVSCHLVELDTDGQPSSPELSAAQ